MTTTRTMQHTATGDGFTEIESAALSSVEFTVDSKGAIKPSVKAYAADVMAAEAQAAEALKRALARIKNGEFWTGG